MKAKQIREKSNEELIRQREELKRDLVDFRMKSATGIKENVREHRNNRRDIARINTILRERQLNAAGAAKE